MITMQMAMKIRRLAYRARLRCRYNGADPLDSSKSWDQGTCCFDVGIDRHDRAPPAGRVCGVPRAACAGLDRAAGAALSQSAARPDRGPHLRPRMATRLRQAAAAAVVAGRDRLPLDRG